MKLGYSRSIQHTDGSATHGWVVERENCLGFRVLVCPKSSGPVRVGATPAGCWKVVALA